MKIKKLHIKNYKNLNADLVHNSDLIAFIGNNGSGKSNLLEAISHIFRSLYKSSYKVDFDYTIEYETSKLSRVKIEKKGSQRNFFVNEKTVIDITPYLPQKVIAIYSGEENRLFGDCYGPFYLEFVRNINKAQIQGTEFSDLPKMLYLNKFYWHLSLLTLLVSDLEDNQKFVKEVLKIDTVDKIKIDFLKANYEEYNDNQALRLVKDIDGKSEYELEEFKKLITDKGYTAYDLYKYLYLAFTPDKSKIIKDIAVKFNTNLTIADLSEGEKKLLLIKGALEFAGQEDSIFILDEPDAHIHINNKEQITNSFQEYLHNRQIVITTHSPTLTQCVKDENVYMLNSGKIEDRSRQEIIQEVTGEFWNKHQQNTFLAIKKDTILLEGKTDIMQIESALKKLQSLDKKYNSLAFKYLPFGGASGLKLFVDEFPVNTEYRTFAFVDRDQAGYDAIKEVTEFQGTKDEYKGRLKNGIYVDYIPKKANHSKSDFIIEDYFDFNIYQDFLLTNVTSVTDLPNNNSARFKKKFAEHTSTLNPNKFEGFRVLFDLILDIKKDSIQPVNISFSKIAENKSKIIEIYTKRRGTNIVAHFDPSSEKVTIQSESIISTDVVPSYKAKEKTERNRLKKKHCEFIDEKWIVKTPIEFASPSGAIKFGVGSNINGWKYWLLKANKKELQSLRKK